MAMLITGKGVRMTRQNLGSPALRFSCSADIPSSEVKVSTNVSGRINKVYPFIKDKYVSGELTKVVTLHKGEILMYASPDMITTLDLTKVRLLNLYVDLPNLQSLKLDLSSFSDAEALSLVKSLPRTKSKALLEIYPARQSQLTLVEASELGYSPKVLEL